METSIIKICYDDDDIDDDEVEMGLGTFGCLPDLSNRINYQQQGDYEEGRKHQ